MSEALYYTSPHVANLELSIFEEKSHNQWVLLKLSNVFEKNHTKEKNMSRQILTQSNNTFTMTQAVG